MASPVKVVVTGARGQLGTELCRQLGGDAIAFDVDTLDVTDRAAVSDVLSALDPGLVINCAAYTQVDRAVLFLAGMTRPEPAHWGIYHVTNRGSTTWFDFAAEIFRQADMGVTLEPITTAEYGAAASRPAYSVLDTAAYDRLGGPAMPEWEAAVGEYLAERESAAPPAGT